MTPSNPPDKTKPRALTARRVTLLASVAAVGAAMLIAGPNGYWPSGLQFGTPAARAADDTTAHPAGFADLVTKVKPAVISVRVKIPASAQPAMMQDDSQGQDGGNG